MVGENAEVETIERPKVLIVDDSRMVRASLIKQICDRFQVREESDGEAGWEALLIDPDIQLVLTDLSMPKLDGYGLIERIRGSRVPRIHDLPVVIISGDEGDESRDYALKIGASDFVSKGAGCAEMAARLESLLLLASAQRELEASRMALAEQSPVDPVSGLATPAYLNHSAEKQLAQARRYHMAISTMVIEVDHYEQLVEQCGNHVARLIVRKLSQVFSTKVRREDTVTQLSGTRFAVLAANTALSGCHAFAQRLQNLIGKLAIVYRDKQVGVSVSIGLSDSETDGVQSVEHLVEAATERVLRGVAAGGGCIVSEYCEDGYTVPAASIDQALLQIQMGMDNDIIRRLPDLVDVAMPLFRLIEEQFHLGIPLDELEHLDRVR